MSTADPNPISVRSYFGPTLRYFILVWLAMFAGGAVLLYWTDSKDSALRHDLDSKGSAIDALAKTIQKRDPAVASEFEQVRQQFQEAQQRVETLEKTLDSYNAKFQQLNERSSEAESRRTVERARTAIVAAQVESAHERLRKIKTLMTAWQAKDASLMTSDLGRRIVASPAHLSLALGIIEQERPGAEQLRQWEAALNELAKSVEESQRNKDSTFVVTTEHVKMLSDLGQELARTNASLEQQSSLVEALAKETASVKPAAHTFGHVVEQRRIERDKATTDRLKAAREAARAEVEIEQADRLRRIEKLTQESATLFDEKTAQAKKEQQEQLARVENEKIAEETRVKEAQSRATIAGLRDEAIRLDAATQRAKLEKEFERDLPKIRSVLTTFLSPGFQQRGQSKGEGPMSFAAIQRAGALAQTSNGRQDLAHLVGNNDRPSGPLRAFRGGQTREEEAMCNQAQELLMKYGPLMVEKGMLAP